MASQLDVASRLAAISRLSGGVAHEIKNPLNAILLRLDLLRERLGAPEEELALEIGILSKEVLRLDRVVKTFLDFSRPLEVRFQDLDLAEVAREVADLMAPQARHSGIEIEFRSPASGNSPAGTVLGSGSTGTLTSLGLRSAGAVGSVAALAPGSQPARVWMRGDSDLLKQAILNLVTNAMEAMKAGGHLRITVESQEKNVTLEVADTGPGIPPEVQAKVFQLYFTTKERGSGIGLAMTYRAAQLHNGTIDFTSEPGHGTVFILKFPALAGTGDGA
jgi:hypothetical protein